MKFDKETVIVLAVAVVILIGWSFYYPKYQRSVKEENARIQRQTAVTKVNAPATSAATTPAAAGTNVPSVNGSENAAAKNVTPAVSAEELNAAKVVELSNDLVTVAVHTGTGEIRSVRLLKYPGSDKTTPIRVGDSGKYNTFCTEITDSPVTAFRCLKESADILILQREYQNGLTVTQDYQLDPENYLVRSTCRLSGNTAVVLPQFRVWTCGVPPLNELSGERVNSDRHNIDFCPAGGNSAESVNPDAKESKFAAAATSQPVAWFGSTNKYFASLLFCMPDNPQSAGICLDRVYHPGKTDPGKNYVVPSVGGVYRDVTVLPEKPVTFRFEYYCGPKEFSRISKLPAGTMDVMHISYWSWFEFIARPLTRFLLWLKQLCGSYGIAIILLTVIVRLVFWPITQKANSSMRRMQKLQPKIKELRERYKEPNQQQELNMRMMELYKQEKVNPLGGCLPLLLQIPVFFALYSTLDSAVELRQVAFLWASDLTKADVVGPVLQLPFFGPVGFHPLVIAMTVLMVIQQKMMPAAGDPMQQKMMMAMPIVMLIFCYNLPSGLTLYWTVSQVFSILQLKFSQRLAEKEDAGTDSQNNRKQKTAKP